MKYHNFFFDILIFSKNENALLALVFLGNFATRFIFKKYNLRDKLEGISKIHGKIFEPQITAEDIQSSLFEQKRKGTKEVKIIPLYHPAVATYNANMKEVLKKDFQILEQFK